VLVDAERLRAHGLRYDPAYLESEDYELWARLLRVAGGDNLREPLLLKRSHPGQATQRRRDLQRSFQRTVALSEIARVAPGLGEREAELAWRLGAREPIRPEDALDAADAFAALLRSFGERRGGVPPPVRSSAARALARAALALEGGPRRELLRRVLRLDPGLPLAQLARSGRRRRLARAAGEGALRWLDALSRPRGGPVRVTLVSPEPTPYRAPLLDLVSKRPEVDLTVVYAARTVAGRTWEVELRHRAVFLGGVRAPGLRRLLRHDYPIDLGVWGVLRASRPDVVVVSGWSTFASQAALAWCRLRRVPYVLLVSSHDAGGRPGWRRLLRALVVPRVVRGAESGLVLGTLSRESLVRSGARPESLRVFANTVDVDDWAARADVAAGRRRELRAALGAGDEDVVVLSVGRLAPEKRLDALVRAIAAAADPRLLLVLAGSGPERERLVRLAGELGVRLVLAGDVPHERLVETYAAADVFALLSSWEPWGVVVNEAAACGLPLVLSDRVGAAPDLLRDGENGALVPAGDVAAAAAALRRLADDAELRRSAGAASRRLVSGWGYGPSVESFVAAVREAARR